MKVTRTIGGCSTGILIALLLASGLTLSPKPAFADTSVANLPPEFDLNLQAQVPQAGSVRLFFNLQAFKQGVLFNEKTFTQGYCLVVAPGELDLYRRLPTWSSSGAATLLQRAPLYPQDNVANLMQITLERRKGSIGVLVGSRIALNQQDDFAYGGTAEVQTSGGAAVTTLKMQPIEPLYFADDFMRQPTEAGEWSYVSGQWKIQTVGTTQWGANPFSLESQGGPSSLASAGYPFWSSYRFEAAAKGSAATAFGICAGLQDAKNYYLLRWTTGPDGALMLLRVVDGKALLLAQRKGGFIPELWYQLALRMSGGRLLAEVDHRTELSVVDGTFGKGKIGLYSEGTADSVVHFDSVLVRPANLLSINFASQRPPFEAVPELRGQEAVGGDPGWENCTVTAEVVGSATPVGILFHYRDPRNYDLFSWDATQCKLSAVSNGQARQLSAGREGVAAGRKATVQVGATDGYLWAAIDGKRVVEGLDLSVLAGRAGLEPASAAGPVIQSLTAAAEDPPESTDALTAEFTDVSHHKEMQGWSGPLNAWEKASFGPETGYWHKTNLYGDTTVKIPLADKDLRDNKLALVLNGDGKAGNSGYEVDYDAIAAGISLTIRRQGVLVASAEGKAPEGQQDTLTLDVHRQGAFVAATVGRLVAVGYVDPAPLDGYTPGQPLESAASRDGHCRLGLIVRGTEPHMDQVVVNNRHVYAETFHLAPVNWRPQSGDWTLTSRWSCTPGWTWYGGKSTGYAVNWYKSPLWGDQGIDSYSGVMMSAVPHSDEKGYHEQWRDLDCAFCSDGVNLFSGYTLVVGGWEGGTTRLYRKGHVVAETTAFAFPPYTVSHRLWFNTHIIKQGPSIHVTLSYYGEDAQHHVFPLIDWTDPEPLKGGYTGFWTYDNGMMIARAVLSAQDVGQRPLYTADKVWLTHTADSVPYPSFPEAGEAAKPLLPADLLTAEAAPVTLTNADSNPTPPQNTPVTLP